MSYASYLSFQSQAFLGQDGYFFEEGRQILQKTSAKTVIFSTLVYQGENFLFSQSVAFLQTFRWHSKDGHLEFNPKTESIYYVQEIPCVKHYVFFRIFLHQFLIQAKAWEEFFDNCCKKCD